MEYISNADFFEIRLGSILSDSDRKVLCDLYQPIVGANAIALFFKLWSDAQTDQEKGFYSFEKLLTNMQISSSELLNERRHLEALGLLKTYVKEISKEKHTFLLVLYSPKQPKDFFNDPFFNSLLTKYVGRREVQKLANYYKLRINVDDYKEITAVFGEVFRTDIISSRFGMTTDLPSLKGHDSNDILTNFDSSHFVELIIKRYAVNKDFLTDNEIMQLNKIASIYGANEELCAEYLEYYCDFNAKHGERLKIEKIGQTLKNVTAYNRIDLKKKVRSTHSFNPTDGKFADMIALMEKTPAAKFLSLLQNNTVPSSSDLALIERLSSNFNLSSGIINALISYTLETQNNTLPTKYVEKIAASLVRENVSNVVETMNYLYRINQKQKAKEKMFSSFQTNKLFNDDEDDNFQTPSKDEED